MPTDSGRPCYDDEAYAVLDALAAEWRAVEDEWIERRNAIRAEHNERWRTYLRLRQAERTGE